jgi:L-threonylcarbamoyladenylate synthase
VDRPDRRGGRTRDKNQLLVAVDALRAGKLVAFPTETVYGLGADAASSEAVRRLYAVKRRPADHPVIVHVARATQLDEIARDVPDDAHALAAAFWPGPLTLVVARNPQRVVSEVTGGRDTVGVRVPDHPIALELLELFGGGVAAPSANRFGRVSPTTADHVRADLGDEAGIVLDGGPSRVGVESTIVDVTGVTPAILRVGGVSRAAIESRLGRACDLRTSGERAAPGTLASHYAPNAHVEIVDAAEVAARAREAGALGRRVGLLAMKPPDRELPDDLVLLASPCDVDEYARVLYARLREADERALDVLLVVLPGPAGNRDTDGLEAAIADRVCRASH